MGRVEDEARRERLKRALRENLKRRKAQVRGRAGTATGSDASPPGESAGAGPNPAGPRPRDDDD